MKLFKNNLNAFVFLLSIEKKLIKLPKQLRNKWKAKRITADIPV